MLPLQKFSADNFYDAGIRMYMQYVKVFPRGTFPVYGTLSNPVRRMM